MATPLKALDSLDTLGCLSGVCCFHLERVHLSSIWVDEVLRQLVVALSSFCWGVIVLIFILQRTLGCAEHDKKLFECLISLGDGGAFFGRGHVAWGAAGLLASDSCHSRTLIGGFLYRWNLNNSERYALQYVDGHQAYITESVSAPEKLSEAALYLSISLAGISNQGLRTGK